MKSIKVRVMTVMIKKVVSFFFQEKIGDTAELAETAMTKRHPP